MRSGSSWRCQLSRAMRLALRWCRLRRPQKGVRGGETKPWISGRLLELWIYSKLLLKSLYFNSLSNSDTLLDCAFEPVYWIVDNVTRWFGVVFVCLVVLLTTSVVVIVYLFVLPTFFSTYPLHWVSWHLCCGHWLLMMVVFHYYKAITTSPGHPPKDKIHIPSVSICKKCITPKPPRTHHCSICNMCVLKMDHHCPWLNNCVGHLNHRYFISFCLYMTLGCIYCSISSRTLFLEAYSAVEWHLPDGSKKAEVELGVLSDPSSALHVKRDHCSQEYYLPLGADQLSGSSSGRPQPVAPHTHQQRRDQRRAAHQQQRDQKTTGEGQDVQKSIPSRCDEQLEVTVWCGKKKSLVHAGPLAVQPSSQRGRHHVGLHLYQKRPHGHLSLTLFTLNHIKKLLHF